MKTIILIFTLLISINIYSQNPIEKMFNDFEQNKKEARERQDKIYEDYINSVKEDKQEIIIINNNVSDNKNELFENIIKIQNNPFSEIIFKMNTANSSNINFKDNYNNIDNSKVLKILCSF